MHAIQIRHFILMTTFSLIYISGPNKCTVSHVYISPLSELESFKYFPRLLLAPENGKMLHSTFSKLNCSPRLLLAPEKGEMLHPSVLKLICSSWPLLATECVRGLGLLYVASRLTQCARNWENMLLDLNLNLNPPFEAAFCARKWENMLLDLKLNEAAFCARVAHKLLYAEPTFYMASLARLTQPLKHDDS